MASWLAHSRYIPIREGLINHLRRTKYRFRKLDPVIFLCERTRARAGTPSGPT